MRRTITRGTRAGARLLVASGLPWLFATAPLGAQAGAVGAAPPPCDVPRRLWLDDVTGPWADFARAAGLVGATPLRSWLIRRASSTPAFDFCDREAGPWSTRIGPAPDSATRRIRVLPARMASHFNSAYPDDRNNGAVWAGRGWSGVSQGGVSARWGALSAAVRPSANYQENRPFATVAIEFPDRSAYVNPWHAREIDWPQRLGNEHFWTLDPGQSYLRLDVRGAALGVSTENLWWGPAVRNPILLSNTAAGFPHAFAGTSRPVDIAIGWLEAEAIWGRLEASDYLSADAADRWRAFGGLVLAFTPRRLPGLAIGAARIYEARVPAAGVGLREALTLPYGGTLGQGEPPRDDEMLALYLRWAAPGSAFEVYAEWAREEPWESFQDLLREPDHTQGYTLGFQKVFEGDLRWVRLYGELTHLLRSVTDEGKRPIPPYFTSGTVTQGHTHRGQLLGAGIGPGSDSGLLGLEAITRWGRTGIYGERIRHDSDAYYANWSRFYGVHGHDIEVLAGLSQLVFLGPLDVSVTASAAQRRSRDFLGFDGKPRDFEVEQNWGLRLEAAWRPR